MIKYLCLLFIVALSALSALSQSNGSSDTLSLIFYQDISACVKCYDIPMALIKELNNSSNEVIVIEPIAGVRCKRKKEVDIYKHAYSWDGKTLIADKEYYQRENIPRNALFTIKYGGKNYGNYSEYKDLDELKGKILDIANSLDKD